jgi:ABC-2 type transport system ATP-binding protein
MISVKNLVKAYGNNPPAVKGVSFDINKGEIVGLLGPNGAGKTTIMRILTCYMYPSGGEALVDGKNVLEDPIGVKKLIGYLPESMPHYTDMTVYEYLSFSAEIRGVAEGEIESAIAKVVELTSLESVVAKKIRELSLGYRKRVGLASVMVHDPAILILDEPTTGLDPNQIIAFRRMIRRLSEKKTIILSTHVLSEIEAICERVIIIKDGNIAVDDTIQNLVNKHTEDQYIDFSVQGGNLLDMEVEFEKIKKSAWKIEFLKKEAKNIFTFRALVSNASSFEGDIRSVFAKNNWKEVSFVKHSANLEEIFLKLTGGNE